MDEKQENDREIVEHVNNLQKLCRLCGKSTKNNERTCKTNFSMELLQLYDIDVFKDIPSVHPEFLCQSCRCHLYRSKSDTQQKKSKKPRITPQLDKKKMKTPRQFIQHERNCEICTLDMLAKNEASGSQDKTSSESKIQQIIQQFELLDVEEKNICVQKILESYMPLSLLKEQIAKVSCQYPHGNIERLNNFYPHEYLSALDSRLLHILLSITRQTKDTIQIQTIIPQIESIYRLIEKDFIGIWSFMQNLVTFSCTKSRQACNILGTAIPGGKYSYISSYLNSTEKDTESPCPKGDVAFIFDNEQVIGKTWNINAQNKVKMSVITNVAVVQIPTSSPLQEMPEYSPKLWLTSERNDETVKEMCENPEDDGNMFNKQLIDTHYEELYHHLHNVIGHVKEELHQKDETGKWQDALDIEISKKMENLYNQTCQKCHTKFGKRARKCPNCQEKKSKNSQSVQEKSHNAQNTFLGQEEVKNVTTFCRHHGISNVEKHTGSKKKSVEPDQQYAHVQSFHSGSPVEVTLLDPVFVNPNSIESMILILRFIGKKANIKKYISEEQKEDVYIRSWTFVCCDGLPHSLVRRLVEEYFICSLCKEGYLGIEEAQNHAEKKHPGTTPYFSKEFDWVFLLTGEGHYEMNLMKSFMELNWTVFMKQFVELMGWKSEKALHCAQHCTDNHKTWQLINAFHFGSMMELVRPYVIDCLEKSLDCTAHGFISFVKQYDKTQCNVNFMYLFEMVCKYSQGIINLRAAVRRNNPQLLMSAKWMTKELFHGRNHPKYQEIEIYETFIRRILPDVLKQFFEQFCSLSKSGNKSRGQGLDFLLEEENKNVKGWLKRGVPSDESWLATCRNHQSLKNLKKNVLAHACVESLECNDRELKIESAIKEWRCHLRESKYIESDSHGPVLTSLSGHVLCQELVNFTTEANRKRSYRILDMILHQTHI
ncbi:uncharacterized protein LOC134259320 [Saccostrea cucullata]|uniref:uncharacterized protein LOC134259320 n=1 Tax=Saccostrea cuccullata TaxID=36930 RepID=UPI002ED4E473